MRSRRRPRFDGPGEAEAGEAEAESGAEGVAGVASDSEQDAGGGGGSGRRRCYPAAAAKVAWAGVEEEGASADADAEAAAEAAARAAEDAAFAGPAGLHENSSLTALLLSNNGVTHEALSALARALALHGNIIELDMSVNPLSDEPHAVKPGAQISEVREGGEMVFGAAAHSAAAAAHATAIAAHTATAATAAAAAAAAGGAWWLRGEGDEWRWPQAVTTF
jgi:SWI/SNF-related matrix-associated actin-dependent regulator 1 of chromatin subfamily A